MKFSLNPQAKPILKKKKFKKKIINKINYYYYFLKKINYESWNKGLISEDRGNKPTLPLTIPRSLHKSSAKDSVPPDVLKLPFRSLGI